MVAPTLFPAPSNGRSARVTLELRIGTLRLPLAQVGGDRMIFDQSVVLPGTTGQVYAQIDDHQQRWSVAWTASDTPRKIIAAIFHEAN